MPSKRSVGGSNDDGAEPVIPEKISPSGEEDAWSLVLGVVDVGVVIGVPWLDENEKDVTDERNCVRRNDVNIIFVAAIVLFVLFC